MSFSLKGWKTVVLNAAVLIAALLELVGMLDGMTGGLLGISKYGAAAIAALSAANIALRYFTTSPIFTGDAPAVQTQLNETVAAGDALIGSVKDALKS